MMRFHRALPRGVMPPFRAYSSLPPFKPTTGPPRYLGHTLAALGAVGIYAAVQRHRHRPVVEPTTAFDGTPGTIWEELEPCIKLTMPLGPYGTSDYTTFTQPYLPLGACFDFLHKLEESHEVKREGSPIAKWQANVLPGNDACEDRHAVDWISRDDLPRLGRSGGFWKNWFEAKNQQEGDGRRDLMFFSVWDGHSGSEWSDLAKRTLHACLAWTLSTSTVGERLFSVTDTQPATMRDKIAQLLSATISAFDANVLAAPLDVLRGRISSPQPAILPSPPPALLKLSSGERAGTCGLTAVVDVENDDLYIANIGDCRAVAGWYNPKEGVWRCDTLSQDLMGDNPNEAEKVRSVHPEEEHDNVLFCAGWGDRIMGMMQPTRSLGDAHWKRSVEDDARIRDECQEDVWTCDGIHLTPPYVLSAPDITHRKLHPSNGESLKFLILSTDGLWDRLSSEEATLLLAGYLNDPAQGHVPKTSLPQEIHFSAPPQERPFPVEPLPGTKASDANATWAFEGDDNAATHLIKNSLAGGDLRHRHRVLSLRGRMGKLLRDDVTSLVVFFDEDESEN